ncbi:MAG TPA: sugar phosphate isomerase/epimerase family protein [Opitutus sp.]|nr:sugar phosphate isomerase/epimerase family protein [Opitutus sp.]
MNRRTFIFNTSGLIISAWMLPAVSFAASDNRMDRIGMGTVLFRNRFKQTRPKDLKTAAGDLTLLDVPQFYRDRFKVNQVEFWSYHFESLEPGYLEQLKNKLRAAGSTLVNIQVDTNYNMASADELKRRESIAHVKPWIDAAALLGSRAIRINPGNGPFEKSVESMREVNAYAKSKGIPLLTENHFGIEMDPEVHLRLRDEAGPENFYTLPDFGNYSDEVRYAALEKILPYAYLVSAKAAEFRDNSGSLEHVSYDFDRCVRMAEKAGFKGVYSVEQWTRSNPDIDYEKVGDWLIEHVKANI